MNKNELMQISVAINNLAKAEAHRTRAFIVSEQLKAGMIDLKTANELFNTLYNKSMMIGP